jgi:4-hydroxy-tetrahydrodipicolinate synthase
MKKCVFTGSGVAIVTPFTQDGIDFDKLGELIDFQIREKTDAIVICGTTGEASTMPDEEHISVIAYAVKKVNGRVPVIAGTGSNDTRHAIHLTKRAQEVGADAILSVTPYYNKTTQRGLYEHFKVIAESITIPVILYNVPSRTNLNLNPETLQKLSKIDNIVAVKECNLNQVGETINLCGDDFTVYSGEDGLIVPLMSLGGKGIISVMANIIPKDTHDIAASYLAGDLESARRLQLKTLELIKALFNEVSPIPIKEAMNLMGMQVGKCRMPLVDISDANRDLLVKAMKNYGLLG